MQEVAHALRLLALALAAASPAHAVVKLGEVQTRSALGEVLDSRIPFTVTEGTSVNASCFALVREAADGPQMLGEGVLTIERRLGEKSLHVRTLAPVMVPAITLRVRALCPGGDGSDTREYTVELTRRAGSTPAPITAPTFAAPIPAAAPIPVVAQLAARGGESLRSLATKVYPGNAAARDGYLDALRSLNPELAALGDQEPIAEDALVAMPDLRSAPPRARASRAPTKLAEGSPPPAAPKPKREPAVTAEPAAKREPATKRVAPPKPELAEAPALPEAAPKRAAPARAQSGGYVLKLSSSEIDLSRSRQVDDRMRAQLRERLLVLDADDQVAAMLSMRHSLKQLETRVAEMQLKLDAMPASLAARAAKVEGAPPPKVEPPKAEPAKAKIEPPAPKVEPRKLEPPKVDAPPPPVAPPVTPPAAKIEPPVVDPPVAKVASPPKVEPAPKVATAPKEPAGATRPIKMPPTDPGLPDWLWWVAGALVALVALIGAWVWRRRNAVPADEWSAQRETETAAHTLQEAAPLPEPEPDLEPLSVASEDHIEIAAEVRPELASDAGLATRLKEDSGELRRRYIEERFPEIQNRTIVLEDPASVVKGARLFYEDGALSRAVELLQFAVEDKPAEVRPWLALFEIFRLERLPGEFAELAQRFKLGHEKNDYWRKVQYFGREIDPANELYREEPLNTLETIGPREAKRLAAGLSSVGAPSSNFDPIAENWLNAPMDFENEVLANEMRMGLMAGAGLTEQDLIPNPMPALRSVEMFTVA